jgi:hypothetical protein
MLYRLSAVVVVLAVCAGSPRADDKDKKAEKTTVKCTAVKWDSEKGTVCVKTADGEKDYKVGEDMQFMTQGSKQLFKPNLGGAKSPARQGFMAHMMHPGNELELVIADDKVCELHVIALHPDAPQAPAGKGSKKEDKKDDKKDDKKTDGK